MCYHVNVLSDRSWAARHLFCCLQKLTGVSAVGRHLLQPTKGTQFYIPAGNRKPYVLLWEPEKDPENQEHGWALPTIPVLDFHGASLPSTNEDKCHPPPLSVLQGTGGGSKANTSKVRKSYGDRSEGCLPWEPGGQRSLWTRLL